MATAKETDKRQDAVARARAFSPFLRETLGARPELAGVFLNKGGRAAIAAALVPGDGLVEAELRRARLGLAVTVALGYIGAGLEGRWEVKLLFVAGLLLLGVALRLIDLRWLSALRSAKATV